MGRLSHRNALQSRTRLFEYRLEAVLGAGGFGITYLAHDTQLDKRVAIKEHLPLALAVRRPDGGVEPLTGDGAAEYQEGLARFLAEARTLAKLSHPSVVRVSRHFEAHGTAYLVMDYEQGEPLSALYKRAGQLDEAALRSLLLPLLDGLEAVHDAGFLHRDVKPGNIFLRDGGTPMLLDFGAARQTGGRTARGLTSILTPGYAPLEQYTAAGRQGPWSDLYALAGVAFRAVVGEPPPEAVGRLRSDAVPARLATAQHRVSAPLLQAIAWGLTLDERRRPQRVAQWREAVIAVAPARRRARPNPPPAPSRRWIAFAVAASASLVLVATQTARQQGEPLAAAPPPALPSPLGEEKPGEPAPVPEDEPEAAAASEPEPQLQPAPRSAQAPQPVRPPALPASPPNPERRQGAGSPLSADQNGDGYLTREEARSLPYVSAHFEQLDLDADGRLSITELQRARQAARERRGPGDASVGGAGFFRRMGEGSSRRSP